MTLTTCGRHGGCDEGAGHVGACRSGGELINQTGRLNPDRFNYGEAANPWAGTAPDCPQGHHARRVYLWSYEPDDPSPWFCVDCKRRFNRGQSDGG